MEQIQELYIILVGIFSLTLALGIVLEISIFPSLGDNKKLLIILGVVNLLSMGALLLKTSFKEVALPNQLSLIISSIILVLNLLLGGFVYNSTKNSQIRFSDGIIKLFILSFVSIVIINVIYISMGSDHGLLHQSNKSFLYVFVGLCVLLVYGSVIPGILSLKQFIENNISRKIYILLAVNGLNNLIGLLFFTLQLPNKDVSIILNIISNLIFVFMLSYFFLTDYFETRKKDNKGVVKSNNSEKSFSWNDLKNHLSYWEEAKGFLKSSHSDLIEIIDDLPLSDLEKVHYLLKCLNIKVKDVAEALNVSSKAVEMNRYRINKKLNK